MSKASEASRKSRCVALPRGIVSLGPLAALFAFHLGLQLLHERPRGSGIFCRIILNGTQTVVQPSAILILTRCVIRP